MKHIHGTTGSIKIIVVSLKLHIPVNSRNSHYPNMLFLILPTSLTTFWGILCNEWNISPLKIILITLHDHPSEQSSLLVWFICDTVMLYCYTEWGEQGHSGVVRLNLVVRNFVWDCSFPGSFSYLGTSQNNFL